MRTERPVGIPALLLRSRMPQKRQNKSARCLNQLRNQHTCLLYTSRLEAAIGLPLFEKQGRNKALSTHGRRLVEYARHMLAINDEALRALQDAPLEGDLRLGAPLDVADTILPTLLTHIARSAPRVKLEIRTDRSPFLMDALRAGELDLTISTRFDQEFEGVALRTSPTVWLASADYVHAVSYTHLDVYKRQGIGRVPAGVLGVVVELVVQVPAEHHVAERQAAAQRGQELVAPDVLAQHDAIDVGQADLCLLYTSRCV